MNNNMSKSIAMTALACLWLFNAGVSASTSKLASKPRVIPTAPLGPRLPFPDDKYFQPKYPLPNPNTRWWDVRRKQTTRTWGQDSCSKVTSLPLSLRGGDSTATMEVPVQEQEPAPAPIVTANVTEFLSNFDDAAEDLAIFSDDKLFEEKYGFTMRRYLSNKRDLVFSLNKAADQLTRVSKDTGTAQTVGGSFGIASGLAILGGLGASVVTGGASLAVALAAVGTATGAASAATTITASVVKQAWAKSLSKKINRLFNELKSQDKVVVKAISDINGSIQTIEELSEERDVTEWAKRTWYVGQGTFNTIDFHTAISAMLRTRAQVKQSQLAESFLSGMTDTRSLTELPDFFASGSLSSVSWGVQPSASISLMHANGVKEIVAPGRSIFGKTLVEAGKPTAYIVQGTLAVCGIAIGIWDVVDGSKAIKGSEHARAYRKIANELNAQIKEIEDFCDLLK